MTTYRDSEEAVRRLEHTGGSVPPGDKRRDQPQDSSSLGDLRVNGAVRASSEVGDREEEESDIEEEEEGEEGNGRLESAQETEEGKDEPSRSKSASNPTDRHGSLHDIPSKEETNGVGGIKLRLVRRNKPQTIGLDQGPGDPETTVRRQSGGTESVFVGFGQYITHRRSWEAWINLTSDSHLPHSRQQLDETTVGVSGANHNGRARDAAGAGIDQTQDEGRESESAETEGSRVGELPEARLVGCGLEGTPPSGKHGGLLSIEGSTVGNTIGNICVVVGNVSGRRVARLNIDLLGVCVRRHCVAWEVVLAEMWRRFGAVRV